MDVSTTTTISNYMKDARDKMLQDVKDIKDGKIVQDEDDEQQKKKGKKCKKPVIITESMQNWDELTKFFGKRTLSGTDGGMEETSVLTTAYDRGSS